MIACVQVLKLGTGPLYETRSRKIWSREQDPYQSHRSTNFSSAETLPLSALKDTIGLMQVLRLPANGMKVKVCTLLKRSAPLLTIIRSLNNCLKRNVDL